jgi:hypothetical protein
MLRAIRVTSPGVITDRHTYIHYPFLETCPASGKQFDIDHRGDRYLSARCMYCKAAVRPALGTLFRLGSVLIDAISLCAHVNSTPILPRWLTTTGNNIIGEMVE